MKIKADIYQRGKISVSMDGGMLFICPAIYWMDRAEGFERELTPCEYETFVQTVVLPYCTERAVNLLRYRYHSAKELKTKLCRLMSPLIAETVIRSLAEKNYLNDAAYARRTAQRLSNGKRMSRQGVFRELIAKGIDKETAGEAVEALEIDETETLDEIVSHALCGKSADEKFWRRLYGRMLRLGYTPSAAAAALQRARKADNGLDEVVFGGADE